MMMMYQRLHAANRYQDNMLYNGSKHAAKGGWVQRERFEILTYLYDFLVKEGI